MNQAVLELAAITISVIWEAFPFVVIGAVLAGILEEMVPQQAIAKLIPKNTFLAVLIGSLLGIVFPMCECGIVPVMRRLLRKGLPLGTCVAYMLAGPIVNIVVISSTWIAFRRYGYGEEMVYIRVGMGIITAVVTGLIIQSMFRKLGNSMLNPISIPDADKSTTTALPQVHPSENRAGEKASLFRRLANISETALHDFIDIMVFLTLGSFLAAGARLFILEPNEAIADTFYGNPFISIGVMIFIAFIMCLCSEADAFVAASLTKFSIASKIAFLVSGPMVDIKLIFMFSRVFRAKTIITIVAAVWIQVFLYSLLVHVYVSKFVKPE
ncbi:MAG: permease [Zavarzinella sp.]